VNADTACIKATGDWKAVFKPFPMLSLNVPMY
jgi:hypothetical protein